jgi:hypothetical protein
VDLERIALALFAVKDDGIQCGLTELLLGRVADGEEAEWERLAGADDPAAVGAFVDMVTKAGGFSTLERLDLGGRETNGAIQMPSGADVKVESPPVYIGIETLMTLEPDTSPQRTQKTTDAERAKRREEFNAQIQQRKKEMADAKEERASQGLQPNAQSVVQGEEKNS